MENDQRQGSLGEGVNKGWHTRRATAHRLLQATFASRRSRSLVFFCIVAQFLVLDLNIFFGITKPGSDWAPLWVAGKLAWESPLQAYNFELVSSLQEPLIGAVLDRPFIYPPSALLLFAPLALLPFALSVSLFVLVSLVLISCASRLQKTQIALLLAAPPVVLAAIAGQPTLLVAALIVDGLVQLDRNEARAGLVFGIAAMIKPPLLLLAPIALAGGGYWRAFAVAGISAITIAAISIAAFGFDTWLAWLAMLPAFNGLVTDFEPLLKNAVTPYAMAIRLDFPPNIILAIAALIAIPVTWLSFAKTHDGFVRLVALVGSALLVSPYAMNYELAALAPAVAASQIGKIRNAVMIATWASSLFFSVSILGLLAVYVWAVSRLVSRWRAEGRFLSLDRVEISSCKRGNA